MLTKLLNLSSRRVYLEEKEIRKDRKTSRKKILKEKIKAALKAGEEVQGAKLVENKNLKIGQVKNEEIRIYKTDTEINILAFR